MTLCILAYSYQRFEEAFFLYLQGTCITLKIAAASSTEALIRMYQFTWRNITEYWSLKHFSGLYNVTEIYLKLIQNAPAFHHDRWFSRREFCRQAVS
jgi:hypothetical protein